MRERAVLVVGFCWALVSEHGKLKLTFRIRYFVWICVGFSDIEQVTKCGCALSMKSIKGLLGGELGEEGGLPRSQTLG